jgi:hypothetical protein
VLHRSELGFRPRKIPLTLRRRLAAFRREARAATVRSLEGEPESSNELLYRTVDSLIARSVRELGDLAVRSCASMLYTAAQFAEDLSRFRDDLSSLGIPPIGSPGGHRVALGSILNVAHVVASDDLDRFPFGTSREEKERELDKLTRKAIELSEIQLAWEEAGAS